MSQELLGQGEISACFFERFHCKAMSQRMCAEFPCIGGDATGCGVFLNEKFHRADRQALSPVSTLYSIKFFGNLVTEALLAYPVS